MDISDMFTVMIQIVDGEVIASAFTREPERCSPEEGWVEVYAHPVIDPAVLAWWRLPWEWRDASGYGPPDGAR